MTRASVERLALTWSREAALDAAALVVIDPGPAARAGSLAAFLDRVLGHVVLVGPQPPDGLTRGLHVLGEEPDGPAAMLVRWTRSWGRSGRGSWVLGSARWPRTSGSTKRASHAAVATAGPAIDDAVDGAAAAAALWHVAARCVTPSPLPGVRILEPAYTWDDLVLPPETEAALRRVEVHVRHATR